MTGSIKALVGGREDLISRLAAPLWARVGRPLNQDLSWARALLGEHADEALLAELERCEVVDSVSGIVSARGVAGFIASLLDESQEIGDTQDSAKLVWTLPDSHPSHTVRGRTYAQACHTLINGAHNSLTLISPFLDRQGLGILLTPILSALSRGIEARLFVHDALSPATQTSRALEDLRRESERLRGRLTVYSAEAGMGRDRTTNPLFHAKLIVADGDAVLVGSANLTSYALGSNFEAGVLLGAGAAAEVLMIVDGMLASAAIYVVYQTGPNSTPTRGAK